jgi:1,4-alpha-glucan branching enzyme
MNLSTTRTESAPTATENGEHTPREVPSLFSSDDLYLFNEGSHVRLYDHLGAHPRVIDGVAGTNFACWAPSAHLVSVVGDFNGWMPGAHSMRQRGESGIWELFVPGLGVGTHYKYHVESRFHGYRSDRTDPVGFWQELRPKTASIVADLAYEWGDAEWMQTRHERNNLKAAQAIYEVHLGSWMRQPGDPYAWLSYRELAPKLADYVEKMGFTHVELMPVCEYPFDGSWGYQSVGYFAPTSRFGSPQDFMWFVDHLHQRGIGVILDWVPSHFPSDGHGLAFFDGTHLYEHADPQQGFHPDWGSCVFNYGRHEVRSFLLSSALFWLDKYHVDGLRVDAVASMLYLDYSRKAGEWRPNMYGGNENLEAISFLRRFNEEVYRHHPDVQTFAEESTAWPMVSRPTYVGGLGFGLKWDMGWMHDTLKYLAKEPVHRQYHQNDLTFRMLYAWHENYCLPLSHDEVVHGKGSLVGKMPGDDWQKFGNLRLLFSYMYGMPGKKLLFMGGEFGQWDEWRYDMGLDWHQAQFPPHEGVQCLVRDLNHMYTREMALSEGDCDPAGFQWVDAADAASSVLCFLRKAAWGSDVILCVYNFTPVPRQGYRVGVPFEGYWRELLNSDSTYYWGSGMGNGGGVHAEPVAWHGQPFSVQLTLPPLGAMFFKPAW